MRDDGGKLFRGAEAHGRELAEVARRAVVVGLVVLPSSLFLFGLARAMKAVGR
jgi:hypothetical protein